MKKTMEEILSGAAQHAQKLQRERAGLPAKFAIQHTEDGTYVKEMLFDGQSIEPVWTTKLEDAMFSDQLSVTEMCTKMQAAEYPVTVVSKG